MFHRAKISFLLLVLVLAACGSPRVQNVEPFVQPTSAPVTVSANQDPSPPAVQVTPTLALRQPPSLPPVNVEVSLDASLAVTATLTITGGELTATGVDGSVFNLVVPPGALVSDQEIAMIPVESVADLPLSGGLISAVQLEPGGLEFMSPVTLTIQSPVQVAPGMLAAGFGYRDQGQDFHLYPSFQDVDTLVFSIMHFSGYGAGQGTQSDVDQQAQHKTENSRSQSEQDLAAELAKSKEIDRDRLEPILRAIFENDVLPKLKVAETDDKALEAAVVAMLTWDRNVHLLNMEERFTTERRQGFKSLAKGYLNAFNKAYDRCVKEEKVENAETMIRLSRETELLNGFPDFNLPDLTWQKIQPKLQTCLTFTLEFESLVEVTLETNMKTTSNLVSRVVIKLDPNELAYAGSAMLEYKSYEVEFVGESAALNDFCSWNPEMMGSELTVVDAKLGWENLKGKNPSVNVVMPLSIDPLPFESLQPRCTIDTGGGFLKFKEAVPNAMWAAGWEKAHQDIKVENFASGILGGVYDVYMFSKFERVGGRVLARKQVTKDFNLDGAIGISVVDLTIVHTPGAQ